MPALTPALTAADVMTVAPRSCSVFSSVLEAVLIFRDADCGAVPVVKDGKPVGILTDRDVALALAEHPDLPGLPVSEIMTTGIYTVEPTTSLETIQAKFKEAGVRRLLVVGPGETLVGIVAWADIARYLSDTTIGEVVTEVVEQS